MKDWDIRNDELALLGLKPPEKKVILSISKMGKTPSQIAHHTGIPRSTIQYILKKLEEKHYIWPVVHDKKKVWRSNIPKIVRYIQNIQKK